MKGVRWVAMTVVAAMVAAALWIAIPWLAALCAFASLIGFALFLRDSLPRRKGGDYRLDALRELEEREEVRRLLENEPRIADEAETVCPSCMEPYPSRLRGCPRCDKAGAR